MSFILPRQYKQIADELGIMYAGIRDAIYADGATFASSALDNVQAISGIQDGVDDDNYDGSAAPDDGRLDIDGQPVIQSTPDNNESDDPSDTRFSNWQESSKFTAPQGSIAVDLGSPLSTLLNTTITNNNAKLVAAAQCSAYLTALNGHVVTRVFEVANISAFYQEYAFSPNSDPNLGLFDAVSPTYFSQEFAELSGLLGTTIDSDYVEP